MNRKRRAVHTTGNVAPLYNDSLETQCACEMKRRQWIWHMHEKEDRMFTFVSRWGIRYGHRDSSRVFEWIVHCICVHKYFMRVLYKHKLICIKTSVFVCVCVCFKAVRVGQAELNTQVLQRCISPPWRRQEGVVFDVDFHFFLSFFFCTTVLTLLLRCLLSNTTANVKAAWKSLFHPTWDSSRRLFLVGRLCEVRAAAGVVWNRVESSCSGPLNQTCMDFVFMWDARFVRFFLKPTLFSNYFTDRTSQTLN